MGFGNQVWKQVEWHSLMRIMIRYPYRALSPQETVAGINEI